MPAAAVIGLTAGELAESAVAFLFRLRVPEARPSVEFIMADVLRTDRLRARLERERVLSRAEAARFRRLVALRARRAPLAYVLRHQDFLGLSFQVGPGVLCPRPETEELAEAAARLMEGARFPGSGRRMLDIGTGSGCLAVYLAKRFPDASVTATDISPKALFLARRNAAAHGVGARIRFLKADLFRPWKGGRFDLMVSNPPYVPSPRLSTLSPEVRAEPRLALDGGRDGLDAIRAIVRAAPGMLAPRGRLVLEMDRGHGRRVRALLESAGFSGAAVLKDYQGFDRVATGLWKRRLYAAGRGPAATSFFCRESMVRLSPSRVRAPSS
ncbi:MAG: peptide chain release factor N(5)-glutamine methyltransferase [Elusimicrobia bacterium]|nr:peptide chain release factor N(5)-glutamine methyltransferase [Elusimicrobiota bacterium]